MSCSDYIYNAILECIAARSKRVSLGFYGETLEVKPMHFCKGRRQMVENPKKPKILENPKKNIRKSSATLENQENPKTTPRAGTHSSFDGSSFPGPGASSVRRAQLLFLSPTKINLRNVAKKHLLNTRFSTSRPFFWQNVVIPSS